jgi:hypothetical protein
MSPGAVESRRLISWPMFSLVNIARPGREINLRFRIETYIISDNREDRHPGLPGGLIPSLDPTKPEGSAPGFTVIVAI